MIDILFCDDHYAWIKNFRRFMADLSQKKMKWCRRCMLHFEPADVLKNRQLNCQGVEAKGQLPLTRDALRNVKFENVPSVPSIYFLFNEILNSLPSSILIKCFNGGRYQFSSFFSCQIFF